MRKFLLSLSLLVMTAISAMAQYNVTIESEPENKYFSGYQAFDPTEIAAALGYADTTAFYAALASDKIVYVKGEDGELTNAYTGNLNEFWLGEGATPKPYGAEAAFFVGLSVDREADPQEVDVVIGQMPDHFKYDPFEANFTLYLINGDKQVTFNVTFKLNPLPKPQIADPETSYAKIEVVKEYNFTLDMQVGKSYEGKKVTYPLDGIYDALGVGQSDLDAAIVDVVLTRKMDKTVVESAEPVYAIGDTLATPVSLAGGAWFGRYINYDEEAGQEIVVTPNAPMAWGTGHNTVYTQEFALDNGSFSFVTGQYPDKLVLGDNDVIELFIMNGAKAAKVTLTLNVFKPERIPFEDMTKAGEETVEIVAFVDNNYATKPFSVDMAKILEAIEVESVDDFFAWAAEGEISNNHTEGSGGFFYNDEGYIANWGNDASFFTALTSLEDGQFTIGQMANHFASITEPTTVSADMIFLGTEKYYIVKVQYTVKPEGEAPIEFNKVADESLSMQIIPSGTDYPWGTTSAIDLEYVETILGTSEFTLYTDKWNATDEKLEWSKNYTCTPAPGFWYGITTYENSKHEVVVDNAGWGQNSFGVTYANGVITWYQYPGQRAVGDSYMAHLYLVNEATGDYIDYTLSVKYVEEVAPEAVTVGESEIGHKVTPAEATEAVFTLSINPADMFAALELDEELIDAATLVAPKSSTMYYNASLDETLYYNANGYYVGSESEAMALQATPSFADGKIQLEFDIMDLDFTSEKPLTVPVRFGFEYDGKRYLYTVKLTNQYVSQRLPLTGGSTPGSEMAIEVLENDAKGTPLSAKYTFTNATWGNNASHLSLFKYAPLTAEMIAGYNAVVVLFEGEVPASEGEATYSFIPVGFVCPAGWRSIKNTDKFVYEFSDAEKAGGVEDFSIFFNANGTLKSTEVTIKGVYLTTDAEPVGIDSTPAVVGTPSAIYSITGVKAGAMQRGLNIVKMADGSVVKIFVK